MLPLSWNLIDHKYRIDGTLRFAEAAVDALNGIDEQLVVEYSVNFNLPLFYAVLGTYCNARLILDVNARFCYNVGQNSLLFCGRTRRYSRRLY